MDSPPPTAAPASADVTLPETTTVRVVLLVTLVRLVVNITRRFSYVFAPEIARSMGVPLAAVQNTIAVQSATGVSSPLFGPVMERFGRRRVMIFSLLLLAAAAGFGAVLPQFAVFVLIMIAFGFAKVLYDPAMLAYLGDRVPYARRGAAMGTTELSWAGALLIAAPVLGLLLERTTLQTVFVIFSVLGVLGALLLWRALPPDTPTRQATSTRRIVTPWAAVRQISRTRSGLAALTAALLLTLSNEIFFINYGAFMENSYGLSLASLGGVTIVVGLAELFGASSVAGLSDRLGKRRMALVGTLISGVSYIVLPQLTGSLGLALAALFVMFLFVEIAFVASIPLYSEVMPASRAVMLTGVVGAASMGRLAGAALGSFLLAATGSFMLMGVIATTLALSSALILWRGVSEHASS